MQVNLSEQWESLQKKHAELLDKLSQSYLEPKERAHYQKEAARLGTLLEKQKRIIMLEQTIERTKQEMEQAQPGLIELYQEEMSNLEQELIKAQSDLEEFMIPPDEHADRSVFLEIRAGTGGQEAALFAAD